MEEAAQDVSEGQNKEFQAYVAGLLNNGKELFFEFDDRIYKGDILDIKMGEYVLFRLAEPDEHIIHLPVNYDNCRIRTAVEKGQTYRFHTKLLQKKLPHVLLAFPDSELKGFARGSTRKFMVQTTPIIMKRKENVFIPQDRSGLGTINDVSKGGVRMTTSMPLDKGDKVQIFIDVPTGQGHKKLVFPCVVRRVTPDGSQFDVGLEFFNAPPANLKEVTDLLDGR